MLIRTVLLLCVGAAVLGNCKVAHAGPLPVDESLVEIMMDAQQSFIVSLLEAFGSDAGNTLSFSTQTDFAAGTFSYTADPGSTYQGMLLNFTESGSSDVLGNATYSGSGTIGGMEILASGSNVVVGDPEYDYTDTIKINGVEYKVVGKNKVFFDTPSTSEATLTANGKNYKGVDTLQARPGGIKYTWAIESDPIPDKPGLRGNASGEIDPTNGMGLFEVSTTPVPEPSTVWTTITGLMALCSLPRMLRRTA